VSNLSMSMFLNKDDLDAARMDELVAELRFTAAHLINGIIDDDGQIREAMLWEAADEIERLRAVVSSTGEPNV